MRAVRAIPPVGASLAYRKLGNWEEAEELVQDVFSQALQRIEQLRLPEAFGGWLRQIIRRMAINQLSRRRLTLTIEADVLDGSGAGNQSPLENALNTERRQQVRSGLERLGDTDRRTLEAFYLRGQSLIEMAECFEAPVGTIKRRLHIARKRLAAEMGNYQAIWCPHHAGRNPQARQHWPTGQWVAVGWKLQTNPG